MMPLQTNRLILREWTGSDFAPFAKLNACHHVCEFLPKTLTREESDALANHIIRHAQQHGFGPYAVQTKDTEEFIGFTGLSIPRFEAPFMPAVEIGWRLAYPYWGKGYATEAAKAVLEHGFNHLGLREIVSFTVPGNHRSRHVMAKIGMTHHEADDFDHPKLPEGHTLRRHVLYRIGK
jgi:RimJ/RimL family protein N-acetyltransferase